MHLVGVQDEDLPRQGALDAAPVSERLHPLLGDADCVDVVAVAAERPATETSLEQLDSLHRAGRLDPLVAAARTF